MAEISLHSRISCLALRCSAIIINYIYSSNPWESNYRDGPTGHNKHIMSGAQALAI